MRNAVLRYSDAKGHHGITLNRTSTSIGRSASEDVVLDDPWVSRRHASIVRDGDRYTILDQNSTHGTFLNKVRVEESTLEFGDVLQFGSLQGPQLKFQLQEDVNTTSTSRSSAVHLLSSLSELQACHDELRPAVREMDKLNWLLRAARQLNEGGAIGDILGAFLHLALQLTGLERGLIFLQGVDGLRFAQGIDADGNVVEEDSTVSRRAMQKAIESDSKFSISDTFADKKASEWSSIMMSRIRSIYSVPLRTRACEEEPAQLLGLLYLDSRIRLGELSEIDHHLLNTLATEASALLHNALLVEAESNARHAREELAVAAKIHSELMSIALPTTPYAVLRAKSVPCLAIGGDFYDAVALSDSVCAVVADVSGKGVSAAIVAATVQGIIHSQLLAGYSLPEVASLVNQFLCSRKTGKYTTMILVRLFPDGSVEYLNCGTIQPLAILGREVRRLEASSLVVGLITDASYTSGRFTLRQGERLLLVTDGITETENSSGEQFGDSGLSAVAQLEDLDAILEHVENFRAPNPAEDDSTLLEIRFVGGVAPH